MDTTLTTGTDEAAVEALAVAIDRAEDGAGWFLNVSEGSLAHAILAALRADPADARAVRDAIDPDGLRAALSNIADADEAIRRHGIRGGIGPLLTATFQARIVLEGTPDAD